DAPRTVVVRRNHPDHVASVLARAEHTAAFDRAAEHLRLPARRPRAFAFGGEQRKYPRRCGIEMEAGGTGKRRECGGRGRKTPAGGDGADERGTFHDISP